MVVTSRLQIFVKRCLRKILRIYLPNNISNTELPQRANMEPVDIRMRRQKWGGLVTPFDKCIARKAMEWNPLIVAGRLPGRPRDTCRITVAHESKIIGKSWNELKALAHNRTRWKTGVIDSLCPPWYRVEKEEDILMLLAG